MAHDPELRSNILGTKVVPVILIIASLILIWGFATLIYKVETTPRPVLLASVAKVAEQNSNHKPIYVWREGAPFFHAINDSYSDGTHHNYFTWCDKELMGSHDYGVWFGDLVAAKATGKTPCPDCQKALKPFIDWNPKK